MGENAEMGPVPTAAANTGLTPPPVPVALDLYVLVIVGNHDPRQHQPYWYHLAKIINDEEFKFALSSGAVSPVNAAFNAGRFAIGCDSTRWQIATPFFEETPRIVDIAKTVFDQKLFEVSIPAIGTNCVLNPETRVKGIGKTVVATLEKGGLIPPMPDRLDGSTVIVAGDDKRLVRIEFGQSILGPTNVSVTYSVHRNLPKQDKYYTISGALQHCESDWRHGREFAKELVRRINAVGGD